MDNFIPTGVEKIDSISRSSPGIKYILKMLAVIFGIIGIPVVIFLIYAALTAAPYLK